MLKEGLISLYPFVYDDSCQVISMMIVFIRVKINGVLLIYW